MTAIKLYLEAKQSIFIRFAKLCITQSLCNVNRKVCVTQPVQGNKNLRSDYPRQVHFALGKVKMEGWWSSGKVNLVSVDLLVDKE